LPDNVPTSRDTPAEVWSKIRQTVQWSRLFFDELPPPQKERAVPVVHGHTIEQADYALSAYVEMGVKRVGFGSFGTFGKNDGVNIAHASSVDVARWVIATAARHGIGVHFFGLGVPALVAMIAGLGARSFDSSAWLKAAGFGQVTLPFSRAYNITYRNTRSNLQAGVLWDEFARIKALSGHDCPYCADYDSLAGSKWHRAAHNLLSLAESIAMVNAGAYDRIHAIYAGGSPKYREEAVRWLGVK
jgi:queuine/archaeosine tRNA-ribosyltransferase